MAYTARVALSIFIGATALFVSPLKAEEKAGTKQDAKSGTAAKSTPAPKSQIRVPDKKSSEDQSPEKEEKAAQLLPPPHNFWICVRDCGGGFHLEGNTGRGILTFVDGKPFDTIFEYEGYVVLGGQDGWTYGARDYPVHMFFANNPAPATGKYEIKYRYEGFSFKHFGWAD